MTDLPCLVIVVDRGPAGVSFRIPADRAALQELLLELYEVGAPPTIDLAAFMAEDNAAVDANPLN